MIACGKCSMSRAAHSPRTNMMRGGVPDNRSVATPFGFTGELQDARSGLVYLRARWYDSTNGRFLQHAPFAGFATQPYSLHQYQYAFSNPVRYRDPSGRFCVELVPYPSRPWQRNDEAPVDLHRPRD